MSWRDELVSASFRGVPFKVKSASTEFGRRSVVHEVPFSDIPYPEDFGKAAGVYNITGYIIQNMQNNFNYFSERDALIEALNTKGTGTLSHPYYGELQVVLSGKVSFQETFDQGGIVTFSAVFIEAGKIQVPLSSFDPRSSVEIMSDNLLNKAGSYFKSVYSTKGPSFLSGPIGALGDFQKGLQTVQNTLYRVQSSVAAKVSEALATVGAIRTSIGSIISAPSAIVEAMSNTFNAYRGLIPFLSSDKDAASGVKAALGLLSYGESDDAANSYYTGQLDSIPDTTSARIQQQENRNAIVAYFRVGGFAEAIVSAANIVYESYDQAYDIMISLVNAADNVLEYLAEKKIDSLYDAIQSSKPVFVSALLELGASLPQIRQFDVPADTYPSLVIAKHLYNDLSREQEIINRNKTKLLHPGFPSGGTALGVLGE